MSSIGFEYDRNAEFGIVSQFSGAASTSGSVIVP
tara:strand:+ start:222 stop:323 length:102 start_codon:yes stop_codon:yes gene_type:complete